MSSNHGDRSFSSARHGLSTGLFKSLFMGLCVGLLLANGSHAQSKADMLNQRATAAMCANCHGTDGRVVQGSAIPALAGMPQDYMLLQLKEFKEGSRPATVMHQIAKGLTDAQVQAIANYYASTPR